MRPQMTQGFLPCMSSYSCQKDKITLKFRLYLSTIILKTDIINIGRFLIFNA